MWHPPWRFSHTSKNYLLVLVIRPSSCGFRVGSTTLRIKKLVICNYNTANTKGSNLWEVGGNDQLCLQQIDSVQACGLFVEKKTNHREQLGIYAQKIVWKTERNRIVELWKIGRKRYKFRVSIVMAAKTVKKYLFQEKKKMKNIKI